MKRHRLDPAGRAAITDMVDSHLVHVASGEAANGARKRLLSTLRGQFYVRVGEDEMWHGTDLGEAMDAYDKH